MRNPKKYDTQTKKPTFKDLGRIKWKLKFKNLKMSLKPYFRDTWIRDTIFFFYSTWSSWNLTDMISRNNDF